MNKVVSFADGQPASIAENPDLVEMLEELLARAKAGHITALAAAFCKGDGGVGTRWSGGDQSIPMIAAISLLKHEFLTGMGGRA